MNAEIEHASPYGKKPGEKVPGQRRVIGPAAMRAWVANRGTHPETPPSADEVKTAAPQQPQRRGGGRPFDWLLGTAFAIAQFWWAVKAFRTKTRGW